MADHLDVVIRVPDAAHVTAYHQPHGEYDIRFRVPNGGDLRIGMSPALFRELWEALEGA